MVGAYPHPWSLRSCPANDDLRWTLRPFKLLCSQTVETWNCYRSPTRWLGTSVFLKHIRSHTWEKYINIVLIIWEKQQKYLHLLHLTKWLQINTNLFQEYLSRIKKSFLGTILHLCFLEWSIMISLRLRYKLSVSRICLYRLVTLFGLQTDERHIKENCRTQTSRYEQ